MDKLRVLVVAELGSVGGFISTVLNKKGFDVTVVDSSRSIKETYVEIHAELSRKKYDMVLPTNNGLRPSDIQALIPEIKKKYPDIKIIVLSGFSTPEFIRDLREQGIDDFLSMPFSLDNLVQKVTSIFDGENKIIKEAQKRLDWVTLSYRKKFRCEVISYDGNNYRVRFSQREGLIAIESIPRKEIDDLKTGVKNSLHLEELLGWVRQVVEGRGKS
jgi:DNA-binding response OmpR family regulator